MQTDDSKIQEQYREQINSMFGGVALAAVARKRKVTFVETDGIGGGRVSKGILGSYKVHINTTGQHKNFIAVHELRHILQIDELDRKSPNFFCLTGKSARTAYVQALMSEADAYTLQTLAAFKKDKEHPHLDLVIRQNPCIQETLENKNLQADSCLARALFTGMMVNGLKRHQDLFRSVLFDMIIGAPIKVSNAMWWFTAPTVETFPASPKITDMYGAEFMSGTSMRAIETAFMRTIPIEERAALKKYEQFVRNIPAMSQEEYSRGLSLVHEAFSKAAPKADTAECGKRKKQLKKLAFLDKSVPISNCLARKHRFSGSQPN
jgi:hypothetical protein